MAMPAGTAARSALRPQSLAAPGHLLSSRARAVRPTAARQLSTSSSLSYAGRGRESSRRSSIELRSAESAAFLQSSGWQVARFGQWKGDAGRRHLAVLAVAEVAVAEEARTDAGTTSVKSGSWTWRYDGQPISINHVEHAGSATSADSPTVVLLPAYSDVSTVDEWREVATALAGEPGKERRVVICDWPGLGESDRPAIDYTADVMEQFLVDFITAPDGPLKGVAAPLLVGAGHAATAALRATARGRLQPAAIAAVAPTWGGPLPIVFGKSEKMEARYALLRNGIRLPGLGWALYRYSITSPKSMRMQYLTHVYASADNVKPEFLEQRTELTRREGARFAPASFLSGRLDAVSSREEFLGLFAAMEEKKVPVFVLASEKSPKRSKAEMVAVEGAKGVSGYKWVSGALLPHEEYPQQVAQELKTFLESL